jgi:hypothetical protein
MFSSLFCVSYRIEYLLIFSWRRQWILSKHLRSQSLKFSGLSAFPKLVIFPSQMNRIRKKIDNVRPFGTATHKPWLEWIYTYKGWAFLALAPRPQWSIILFIYRRKQYRVPKGSGFNKLGRWAKSNYEFKQRITPWSITVQTTLTFNQDF